MRILALTLPALMAEKSVVRETQSPRLLISLTALCGIKKNRYTNLGGYSWEQRESFSPAKTRKSYSFEPRRLSQVQRLVFVVL